MAFRARRSPLDWLHWTVGSLGLMLWGGRVRDRARFIRRLLARYPALGEIPPIELQDIAERVTAGVRVGHVTIFSLAAAVAAAYLTTPLLVGLQFLRVRIPMPMKVLLVALAAWAAWHFVRRMLIERQLTSAISQAYPDHFCPCGYCLLGLPPATNCPECGARGRRGGDEAPGASST
jgi:hypothetical protein